MIRLAACTLLLCTGFCSATEPDPALLRPTTEQTARAEDLARKLGSDVFHERDQATRELAEMGRLALGVVERTLAETASAEVRARCETLRPAMQQEELKARLDTFMADADGKYDHKLPAWDKFQKIVGNTAETRKLFSEMFENAPTARVLTASLGTKEEFTRAATERRADIYNRMYGRRMVNINGVGSYERHQPVPAELAGVLFTESLLGTIGERRTSYILNSMLSQSPTHDVITDAAKGAPFRKLIASWCDTRTDTYEEYQAMTLAANLNHKEIPAAKYALKVIDEKSSTPVQQSYAITVLAKCGGKEQLPNILKQFENKTSFTTFFANNNNVAERCEMQTRDVALAMAILLAQKKPEDFGFTPRAANLNDETKFFYNSYRLATDEKRTEAFKKWEESQKKK